MPAMDLQSERGGGADPRGADPGGIDPSATDCGGVDPGGADPSATDSGGAGPSPSPSPRLGRRAPLASAIPLRARLWLAGAGLAAVALIAVLLASGPAGTTSTAAAGGRVSTASLSSFHGALVARLHSQHAYFHWVVCVPSGLRFHGVRVVRCNVDFGDPHIQAYCSVFRGGRLLTSEEDSAIPCGHDNAGYSATIVTYN
jgi:hypothetical protein